VVLECHGTSIMALGWQAEFFTTIGVTFGSLLGSARLSQPFRPHLDPGLLAMMPGSAS
jgi:hypothetical protein